MLGRLTDPGQSEIELRLERLAREQIVVFAVREALRAAPLLCVAGPNGANQLATPSFRAILTAYVAAFESEARPSVRSASNAAFAAANAAFATASLAQAAHAAIYAAARAGTAATAPHAAAAAYSGFGAAYCSARAAAAQTTILEEAFYDLERLEKELSAQQLRAEPLWPFGAPPEFSHAVDRFAKAMTQSSAQPTVWVDWYESKIDGWPELQPFEREWADISDRWWDGEPEILTGVLCKIREGRRPTI